LLLEQYLGYPRQSPAYPPFVRAFQTFAACNVNLRADKLREVQPGSLNDLFHRHLKCVRFEPLQTFDQLLLVQ
jgi:hypothetical protein